MHSLLERAPVLLTLRVNLVMVFAAAEPMAARSVTAASRGSSSAATLVAAARATENVVAVQAPAEASNGRFVPHQGLGIGRGGGPWGKRVAAGAGHVAESAELVAVHEVCGPRAAATLALLVLWRRLLLPLRQQRLLLRPLRRRRLLMLLQLVLLLPLRLVLLMVKLW